jgi:hypothetical protein
MAANKTISAGASMLPRKWLEGVRGWSSLDDFMSHGELPVVFPERAGTAATDRCGDADSSPF